MLRLAGRRARSSSLRGVRRGARGARGASRCRSPGTADWPGRIIAFKGVLLEGVEVVLIVTVLAARPAGAAPALLGAALAVVLVRRRSGSCCTGRCARVPETELKYVVGLVLTAFGTFFAAEGLGVEWPMGDAALLLILAAWLAISPGAGADAGGGRRARAVPA